MTGIDPSSKLPPDWRMRRTQPTYWQALGSRVLAVILAAIVIADYAAEGKAFLLFATRRHSFAVSFAQSPPLFAGILLVDAYIVLHLFFYAPFRRWEFSLRLPEDPPAPADAEDGYEGYVRAPRKLGPLRLEPFHVSELLNTALLRGFLDLACMAGAMVSLLGLYQLVTGTIYVMTDEVIDLLTYATDPGPYVQAACVYAMVAGATLLIGLVLYLWKPETSGKLGLPKLNLGQRHGGNVR